MCASQSLTSSKSGSGLSTIFGCRGEAVAERSLCLYGHTHLPAIFRRLDDHYEGAMPDADREVILPLQRGVQYLVNVGSIGQPRDGDPRAGYGILDADKRELRLYRVRYPVEEAQRKIIAAGLPVSLANRLALGR